MRAVLPAVIVFGFFFAVIHASTAPNVQNLVARVSGVGEVRVSWDAPLAGPRNYTAVRRLGFQFVFADVGEDTSHTWTGLSHGREYIFVVVSMR